jgi:ethanolamine utilization protein EutA
MQPAVKLVGLDFGTTTSSAVVATARLMRNAVTGRMDLDQVSEVYRSDMVFTPLHSDDTIDEQRVEALLDDWLLAGGVQPGEVFGGGALLTGLTAQKTNAAALTCLVRRRLGNTLVATAGDPCLESWLAFMGSAAALSRAHPDQLVLNLDIGGGTTNIAVGKAGEVLRTRCLYIGARHVQVDPGTYRIVRLSHYAKSLFEELGISKGPCDTLSASETGEVLDSYLNELEAAVSGSYSLVTFSGGVGELVYAHLDGKPWPTTTCFGDLGIDLAQHITTAPLWAEQLRRCRPASAGRATVYGLLRHSTEVSGSTLYLPHPEILPLPELPILGTLGSAASDEQMKDVLTLLRQCSQGGCVRIDLPGSDAASVRAVGQRLARILRDSAFPADLPVVLILKENLGKVLGHYVTDWGALPLNLVVIDEIAVRDARYVHIGVPRDQVVPVSFYGLVERGSPSCAS